MVTKTYTPRIVETTSSTDITLFTLKIDDTKVTSADTLVGNFLGAIANVVSNSKIVDWVIRVLEWAGGYVE